MKYNLLIILAIIISPLTFSIYMADRFLLAFFFWMDSPKMTKWSKDAESITYSIIRLVAVGIIYGIYLLIKSI